MGSVVVDLCTTYVLIAVVDLCTGVDLCAVVDFCQVDDRKGHQDAPDGILNRTSIVNPKPQTPQPKSSTKSALPAF